MTLHDWIGAHGPLSAPDAFLIALDICAQLGRSSPRRIGETLASLDTANILRTDVGWAWSPVAEGGRPSADSVAIERLGALLFECLTGDRLRYPPPGEQQLRGQLRALRPNLAAAVVDIVVTASSRPAGMSVSQFALELRQVIANQRTPSSRRRPAVLLAVGVLAVASISWASLYRRENRLELHGLTLPETVALDVLTEMAQAYALAEEHTAAAGLYDGIASIWRRRIPPDDPRDAWNETHLAWVKSLANDRVTAEQFLQAKPAWLASALGVQHPYARAAALELAHAVFARGTPESAAALKEQAERNTATLLEGTIAPSDVLAGIPAPPGTVAHTAKNPPVMEGFRARADGAFAIPLTSSQRWIAGRDGWRLHLVAQDSCHTALAIGDPPRLLELDTSRVDGSGWQIRTHGLVPPQVIHVAGVGKVGVSLLGAPAGDVRLRIQASRTVETRIDESTAAPRPPYTLSFGGRTGPGDCALVWLEIPFPIDPKT